MKVFGTHAKDKSMRICSAFDAKKRAGEFNVKNAPFGYKLSGNRRKPYLIDEPAAEIVREIFALKKAGESIHSIMRIMDEKYPSPRKYLYDKGLVKKISDVTSMKKFSRARLLTREMCVSLIELIEVDKNNNVIITPRYRDEFAYLCERIEKEEKRLLSIEKLDKALVDCLVKSVTIYLEGKIHIEWKFSYFCDIMKKECSRTADDVPEMEISNRVWLYYCSDEGWEKLNSVRQAVSECAEQLGLRVVGDSFDNAGLSLTANGFKEMQRAVRQGRVNAVIVPTLDGVSKTTEVYTSFERGIRKRKVKLYDMHGNLIIG